MIKRSETWICDACGETQVIDPDDCWKKDPATQRKALSKGIGKLHVVATHHSPDSRSVILYKTVGTDFCSLECLQKWTTEQIEECKEDASRLDDLSAALYGDKGEKT